MPKRAKNLLDNKFFLVFLAFVLVVQIASLFFGGEQKPIYTETFFASVEVGSYTGFDVNRTALTFGMVTPGSSSLRALNFENEYGFPVLIDIAGEGDIASFLSFKKVVVEIGGKKRISIGVYAPQNCPYGVYSGNVSVRVFRHLG